MQLDTFGERDGAEKVVDEEEQERRRRAAFIGSSVGSDCRIALWVAGRRGIGEPLARLPRGEAQPGEREGEEQAAWEGETVGVPIGGFKSVSILRRISSIHPSLLPLYRQEQTMPWPDADAHTCACPAQSGSGAARGVPS